jgi:hypothetical protein
VKSIERLEAAQHSSTPQHIAGLRQPRSMRIRTREGSHPTRFPYPQTEMPACKQNRSTHPNPKLSDAEEANGQRSLTVRIQLIADEIERQVGPTTTRCPSASAVLLRNLAKWSVQLLGLASRHLPMKLCP